MNQDQLATALGGMISGAMTEAFGEIAKELRRYAGSRFHECLNGLEARAVRSAENAPIDGISESEQLFLVEQTRTFVRGVFSDARSAV